MQELLKNAWLGWQNYTDNGKLAALLFIALLFLWLRQGEKKQRALLVYGTIMTACCIFPVTAAVLMLYQTRFYDYEWIWSFVPLTLITAYGITEFLTGKKQYSGTADKTRTVDLQDRLCFAGIAFMTLAVILLCGRLGKTVWDTAGDAAAETRGRAVFPVLKEQAPEEGICLLAPREILEYARAYDGSIRLPYGRNMWDESLNGYSYDTYDRTATALYDWMCSLEESAETKPGVTDIGYCIEAARSKGVNRLLLPGEIPPETLARIEEAAGVQAQKLEGYYLLAL